MIPLDRYRNIGLLASLDAGRTTTTERILTATARDLGASADGSSVGSAWIQQDNHRDITLTSAATSCVWRGCQINLIELPTADRIPLAGAVAVLDGAVLVVDATRRVTAGMAAILGDTGRLARIVFVNKLDLPGADLDAVLAELRRHSASRPVVLQLPIGVAQGLDGIVDLLTRQVRYYSVGQPDVLSAEAPVPSELGDTVETLRRDLVASVLPGETDVDAETVTAALREAVAAGRLLPVLAGSAFRNRGIRRLLDGIVDYLPAPSELSVSILGADGTAAERRAADDEPFSGLAFQTVDDPSRGKLTFVRIYSGVVAKGSVALNTTTTNPERIGALVRIHANHTESIDEARTGDVVAVAGLQHTTTGDTLCDPAVPVTLGRIPAFGRRVKH